MRLTGLVTVAEVFGADPHQPSAGVASSQVVGDLGEQFNGGYQHDNTQRFALAQQLAGDPRFSGPARQNQRDAVVVALEALRNAFQRQMLVVAQLVGGQPGVVQLCAPQSRCDGPGLRSRNSVQRTCVRLGCVPLWDRVTGK